MNYRNNTKLGVLLLLMAVFVLATFAPVMAAGCQNGTCGYGQCVGPTCNQVQCPCTNCDPSQCTCTNCNQGQCGPQGCSKVRKHPHLNRFLQAGRYNGGFGLQLNLGGCMNGGCMNGGCR